MPVFACVGLQGSIFKTFDKGIYATRANYFTSTSGARMTPDQAKEAERAAAAAASLDLKDFVDESGKIDNHMLAKYQLSPLDEMVLSQAEFQMSK